MKHCLLDENKICDECTECDRCDLNPDKLCDNCCKCIDPQEENLVLPITDIVTEKETEYLDEYYLGEEADETNVPLIEVDEALQAYWEKRLKEAEDEAKQGE